MGEPWHASCFKCQVGFHVRLYQMSSYHIVLKLNQIANISKYSMRVGSPLSHAHEQWRAKRSGGKESGEEAPSDSRLPGSFRALGYAARACAPTWGSESNVRPFLSTMFVAPGMTAAVTSRNILNTKDRFQTPRRKLKIRRAAEYFRRTSRCFEMRSNVVLSVWFIFWIETKTKDKTVK